MSTLNLTAPAHTYGFRLLPGKLPRFFPRWVEMDRPYMVLATYAAGWAITTHPGTNSYTTDDVAAATHTWAGGQSYTFTDTNGLASALTTAGYTVT